VRVTHFAEQVGRRAARTVLREGRTVVVVAAGAGLGSLFVKAGATVVPGGLGRRPSTGQILEAITLAGTDEVIVLPNDRDTIAAAEAAARTAREPGDLRVAVIPTNAQVQGLAALAVHEPGRSFEEDIVTMSAAARHARSGAVTIAARQAMTTGGPCEPGDVLGVIEGDFVLVGHDLLEVATGVLERLLGGGGELVTLVAGADAGDLAERAAAHLHDAHPTVDVVVYEGGQRRYPLLVGVE
jgi:dihydroxyacetone kinase-like predicted kinase